MIRSLWVAVASHTGLVREHNEDAVGINGFALQGDKARTLYLTLPLDRPQAIAVCDGMGGHAGGERASVLAAQRCTTVDDATALDRASAAALLQQASDEINTISETSAEYRGLGTTVVGAYIAPGGEVLIVNVGDARAYRMESGFLAQLTIDHRSAQTGNLTQTLGGGQRCVLEPAAYDTVVDEAGILLCSDGIADYVDDAAVKAELTRTDSPRSVPDRLVELALAGGGGDNATAVHLRLAPPRRTPQPPTGPLTEGFSR
ncbi:protein phosphatase PrpC [Gordonia araii NBRC 100433]|uniref:Protein phosphatase PrpC n=1 Tax=Gordonia araii NBRC 100433 TaxID=1073574 RepID=G7GY97_9ACTN|nr:protein phosphatase 2C domain-containing protein [Gordonia araii]NNG97430.1 serine/threonine-protein phosphatase [Gordonia araii NBRC 100433]GAB08572.1 protein phosphatase PrpC [Gordonia araii NBRC 100433]